MNSNNKSPPFTSKEVNESVFRLIVFMDYSTAIFAFIGFVIVCDEDPRYFGEFLSMLLPYVIPRVLTLAAIWIIKPQFNTDGIVFNYKPMGKRLFFYLRNVFIKK